MSDPTSPPPFRLSGWPPLPAHGPGQRIGLLGGSFNPPHAGHRHISVMALRRLRLDAVWWLVTPGNPLKDLSELGPHLKRIAHCREVSSHPRIKVTGIEADVGLNRTADTLGYLKLRCPAVRFVWIMGADNLADFHHWFDWRGIAGMMPMAVIDRPGYRYQALAGTAAQALWRHREDESDAMLLADVEPPAWVFLHGPRSMLSSSMLRAAGWKY